MKTLGIGALVISALPALAAAEEYSSNWHQDAEERVGACEKVVVGDGREGLACPAVVIYADDKRAQTVKQQGDESRQALALTQNPQGQLSWYALDSSTEAVVSQAPWSDQGPHQAKRSEATLPTGGMVW